MLWKWLHSSYQLLATNIALRYWILIYQNDISGLSVFFCLGGLIFIGYSYFNDFAGFIRAAFSVLNVMVKIEMIKAIRKPSMKSRGLIPIR